MEKLDHDVLENILYRLPLGTTSSQAKRVCKSWKTIMDGRHRNQVLGLLFACCDHNDDYTDNRIKLYFGEEYDHIDVGNKNNYYSDETLMEMEHCRFSLKYLQTDILVGSCNGLVCFEKRDSGTGMPEPFAVCNPLTGEFIFLKPNFSRVWEEVRQVSSGFGYCQSTNDYKVVRIYALNGDELRRSYVQVYTIGTNVWRDLETCIMNHTFCSTGIFANGVLHWLDIIRHQIIVFDLEDEEFVELPLPPSEVLEHRKSHNKLKLLGGNLCWVQYQYEPYSTHIWAYKRNHDTVEHDHKRDYHKRDYYNENSWNWVKEFSIESCFRPFAILKSNQVLFWGGKRRFYCYDPRTQTIDKLVGDDNDMSCSHIEAIPHANSYVSLKDSGETWYGPGYSAVPQTNISVLLTEVRDAYLGRKRKRQS